MIFRLILGAVLSYLLGSLNFGIILSRKFQKEDVRTHGSGNAGSTNMLRNYGKLPAVATILGDMAKVAVAILLVRLLVGNDLYAQQPIFIKSFAGLFCVLGHIFPCFFRFKGGKGVATCGGMVYDRLADRPDPAGGVFCGRPNYQMGIAGFHLNGNPVPGADGSVL